MELLGGWPAAVRLDFNASLWMSGIYADFKLPGGAILGKGLGCVCGGIPVFPSNALNWQAIYRTSRGGAGGADNGTSLSGLAAWRCGCYQPHNPSTR
jgi:hypothetical protein